MRDPDHGFHVRRRLLGVACVLFGLVGAALLVLERPAVPPTPIICCPRETTLP